VISVASHWIGTELRACLEAFVAGDVRRATELNQALLSSFRFEGTDRWPNPLPSKAILREQGLKVGQCRWPMGPADDELEAAAQALLQELDVLRG
jgi:4-hydroxy-tetrahydrodipicolinate synthase